VNTRYALLSAIKDRFPRFEQSAFSNYNVKIGGKCTGGGEVVASNPFPHRWLPSEGTSALKNETKLCGRRKVKIKRMKWMGGNVFAGSICK
jgi:hypothetical protein